MNSHICCLNCFYFAGSFRVSLVIDWGARDLGTGCLGTFMIRRPTLESSEWLTFLFTSNDIMTTLLLYSEIDRHDVIFFLFLHFMQQNMGNRNVFWSIQ